MATNIGYIYSGTHRTLHFAGRTYTNVSLHEIDTITNRSRGSNDSQVLPRQGLLPSQTSTSTSNQRTPKKPSHNKPKKTEKLEKPMAQVCHDSNNRNKPLPSPVKKHHLKSKAVKRTKAPNHVPKKGVVPERVKQAEKRKEKPKIGEKDARN